MVKVGVKVVRKSNARKPITETVRREGRFIVIKHALAMASVAYQIYPVGPPHTDGTPHTRDTFEIAVNNEVIAKQGHFWTTTALGHRVESDSFSVAFRARGAAFFVEWGTIYMEARPILRTQVKVARRNIANELRAINISLSNG